MARKCEVCGKGPLSGNNVSHANNKNKRRTLPNLQKMSINIDGSKKSLKICSQCLRTIKKTG